MRSWNGVEALRFDQVLDSDPRTPARQYYQYIQYSSVLISIISIISIFSIGQYFQCCPVGRRDPLPVVRCFPARRDPLTPPPYPRYPLREFTPCAPGRSLASHKVTKTVIGRYLQYWSVDSVFVSRHGIGNLEP